MLGDEKMETVQVPNKIMDVIERIERKVSFIEEEVITIKSWLSDDSKLSPYEKKLVDDTIKKVKAGNFTDMITLEDLKKKVGV